MSTTMPRGKYCSMVFRKAPDPNLLLENILLNIGMRVLCATTRAESAAKKTTTRDAFIRVFLASVASPTGERI